jgi:hypothetical protein
MNRGAIHGFDESDRVRLEVFHVVAVSGPLARTMSAVIEGDAAIAIRQRIDLWLEVTPVDQVAVRKNDHLGPRTLLYVVKANPVYLDIRHVPDGIRNRTRLVEHRR